MTLTLYSHQKSYRNGVKGLPKPIGTMFFVTVVAALQSGLRQNRLPVKVAAVRIWSSFCVGNSLMAKQWQFLQYCCLVIPFILSNVSRPNREKFRLGQTSNRVIHPPATIAIPMHRRWLAAVELKAAFWTPPRMPGMDHDFNISLARF
jgi:hypothetical protein